MEKKNKTKKTKITLKEKLPKKSKSISKKLTTAKKIGKKIQKPTSEKVLTIIFYALIVLVIILLLIAIKKDKSTQQTTKSNIVIPLIKVNSKNEFSLDLSSLTKNKEKEYVFEVTNYKKETINNTNTSYQIIITKPTYVSLKVYKNNSDENLLPNNDDQFIITSELSKETKSTDQYKLVIRLNKEASKNSKVNVNIEN